MILSLKKDAEIVEMKDTTNLQSTLKSLSLCATVWQLSVSINKCCSKKWKMSREKEKCATKNFGLSVINHAWYSKYSWLKFKTAYQALSMPFDVHSITVNGNCLLWYWKSPISQSKNFTFGAIHSADCIQDAYSGLTRLSSSTLHWKTTFRK